MLTFPITLFGARTAYRYFRLHITENNDATNEIVIAEIELRIGGVDALPTMTSNTTSGVTTSVSSQFSSSFAAWKAADDTLAGNGWDTNVIAPPWWWKVDFGSGNEKILEDYRIGCKNDAGFPPYMPQIWELQGSNDDSTWVVLDSQTGQTGWTAGAYRTFTIP